MRNTEPPTAEQQRERELEDEQLRQWCGRLVEALEVEGLEVDIESMLGLAGRAARSVLRPAAPLTTFVVGYAAGLAAANGKKSTTDAVADATEVANRLCRDEQSATPRNE